MDSISPLGPAAYEVPFVEKTPEGGLVAQRARGSPIKGGAKKMTSRSAQILVVDDDARIREIIERLLGAAGFGTKSAENGEAGWKMFCAGSFDVVVTDNDMPQLSGLELLRRMRSARSPVPAILMSGTLPWDEKDLPLLLSAGSLLEKPFSGAGLVMAVNNASHLHGEPSSPWPGKG